MQVRGWVLVFCVYSSGCSKTSLDAPANLSVPEMPAQRCIRHYEATSCALRPPLHVSNQSTPTRDPNSGKETGWIAAASEWGVRLNAALNWPKGAQKAWHRDWGDRYALLRKSVQSGPPMARSRCSKASFAHTRGGYYSISTTKPLTRWPLKQMEERRNEHCLNSKIRDGGIGNRIGGGNR